jgi:hypothetical protein
MMRRMAKEGMDGHKKAIYLNGVVDLGIMPVGWGAWKSLGPDDTSSPGLASERCNGTTCAFCSPLQWCEGRIVVARIGILARRRKLCLGSWRPPHPHWHQERLYRSFRR